MNWNVVTAGHATRGVGKTEFGVTVDHDAPLDEEMCRRICDAIVKAVAVEMIRINDELRERAT